MNEPTPTTSVIVKFKTVTPENLNPYSYEMRSDEFVRNLSNTMEYLLAMKVPSDKFKIVNMTQDGCEIQFEDRDTALMFKLSYQL